MLPHRRGFVGLEILAGSRMKDYYSKPLFFLTIAGLILSACGQILPQRDQLPSSAPAPTEIALTNTPFPNTATPIPECKRIAFMMFNWVDKGNPDIYSICPDGSNMIQLTDDPSEDVDPAWSPDGSRIAFASSRSGNRQIYVMDADGDALTQISFDFENDRPIWLPSGGQIAFRTSDGKGFWWWRIIDIDTEGISQLTEPSFDHFFQTPAWSPDGQLIAYMSLEEQAQRNDGSSQIHIRDKDGTNDVALTNDTWVNIKPIWSPDGGKIAFLSERDGDYDIFALYVMDKDGENVRRLTEPSYTEMASFTWSPDGQQIAIGDIGWGRIFIIDLDTGDERELVVLQEGDIVLAPSWQP